MARRGQKLIDPMASAVDKIAKVRDTKAFQRRDADWPFESWDYTEWEECLYEAEKELKSGATNR